MNGRVEVELNRGCWFVDIEMDDSLSLELESFEIGLEEKIVMSRDDYFRSIGSVLLILYSLNSSSDLRLTTSRQPISIPLLDLDGLYTPRDDPH